MSADERRTYDIDVVHVARLARLALDPAHAAAMQGDLEKILAIVAELSEVDVSDVPPTTHPLPFQLPLRDDVAGEPLTPEARDALLAGAPSHDGEAFIVPKVVG